MSMLLFGRLRNAASIAAVVFATGWGPRAIAARVGDGDPGPLTREAMAALATDLEGRGLMADYDSDGRLLVAAGGLAYYYGRVLPGSVPAAAQAQPGLQRRARSQPAGTDDYVLVYDDASGRRMEQRVIPDSANWNTLQAALAALPGVTEVSRDDNGDLTVVIAGRRIYGRLSPRAGTSIAMWVNSDTHLMWAGDLNGDGTGDYYVVYPRQSLVQLLYVYPPSP